MRILLSVILVGSVAAPAAADTFAEVVAGGAFPIGEDEYDDAVDESFKFGVRLGSLGPSGAGGELALDVTPINYDVALPGVDVGGQRFRALIGGRFAAAPKRGVRLFGRVGGGIDVVHTTVEGEIFGVEFENEETDLGLAIEVGGGVLVDAGSFAIGGQVAFPMAFHFDDNDPDDDGDIDFEYNGYDLDLLITLSTPL